ncbi:MAG: 1,4-alpha-glucan branching protein GlgB [Candidatus Velthaea sp.]
MTPRETHVAVLGAVDAYLFAEGTHKRLWDVLGANPRTVEGVEGIAFALWAPNARRVSVVGDFNDWDGRRDPMYLRRECGVWEHFAPGVRAGARYKFELEDAAGRLLPLKADPFARFSEMRPANASVVFTDRTFAWHDDEWMAGRGERQSREAPISIYEVHPGSWKRTDGNGFLSYTDLANDLIPYVAKLGFTHIELLPITEHPFDGSWGYQTTGLFAPTSRFGTPAMFKAFVEAAHAAGVGVILDWVPGHFPTDAHGLAWFDGTHLYEHADPRIGFHRDWGTLVYNLGRTEVAEIMLNSALYWLQEFHIDALRVDAVSSIIYRDYSRESGQWVPNVYGGNENLEATAFLRRFNETVYGEVEGAITIAEESTAFPGVTTPTNLGGLGFGYKWNMGWMHDTLEFFERDALYRGYHLDDISFGLVYAFSENFVLPLSHDEVVHGKRSLLGRMPGRPDERFADLRLLYGLMFAHPGKKLLFSGAEFGQDREWNFNVSLDWHLTDEPLRAGTQTLIGDLNGLYRAQPALHERDAMPDGFEWIQYDDRTNGTVAFVRWSAARQAHLVAICNFSGKQIDGYRIGVPQAGMYREIFNSDSNRYGGHNIGNLGGAMTAPVPMHGRAQSLTLTLPPRATIWLQP